MTENIHRQLAIYKDIVYLYEIAIADILLKCGTLYEYLKITEKDR